MMTSMHSARHAPLVELTRGGEVESLHAGSIAVVDVRGNLLFSAGDAQCMTFTRSAIKPFQATPFVAGGGIRHFELTLPETALLCASHSGEAMHVEAAASILQKAGCETQQLGCGCHVPLHYTLDAPPPPDERFTQLHHNCSGKHAGFLAYCRQHGLPTAGYLDPAHPLQQAVRESVAHYAGIAPNDLKMGIDGCSAPNYGMPLSGLARGFALLAQDAADDVYGDAPARLHEAMTSHPERVSGTGRSDLAFMQTAPGDWVAKIGAEGVQALGIRSAGLGIAVKVADGNARALCVATIAVLQKLGVLPDIAGTPLAALANPVLRNYAGTVTGEVRSTVQLRAA